MIFMVSARWSIETRQPLYLKSSWWWHQINLVAPVSVLVDAVEQELFSDRLQDTVPHCFGRVVAVRKGLVRALSHKLPLPIDEFAFDDLVVQVLDGLRVLHLGKVLVLTNEQLTNLPPQYSARDKMVSPSHYLVNSNHLLTLRPPQRRSSI